MIEPAQHPPDEVDELLEDHEDDAAPVDSVPARWTLTCHEVDDATRSRAGIWSCY